MKTPTIFNLGDQVVRLTLNGRDDLLKYFARAGGQHLSDAELGSYTEYSISGADVRRSKSVSLVPAPRELPVPRPTR
jgi:hypothetical protein